jgi:hypothetical protein
MAISNFLASKWAAGVELIAQEKSIITAVTLGQWQADAAGASAVKINSVSDITIGTYTPGSDITIQALGDAQKTLSLNQKKYFAFYVDDVDAMQSQADFRNPAILQSSGKLALEADTYAFGLHATAGLEINDGGGTPAALAVTSANVEEVILTAKELLDGQNAPEDRVLVIPSWMNTKLALAGMTKYIVPGSIYTEGYVGRYAGFDIYISNSLASGHPLAFSKRAIAFASQVNSVEAGRAEKQFADYVKGLYVFGAVVNWPNEMVDIWVSKGAEA